MSKKMLKRSLALGALMAFVITGSAMAGNVVFDNIDGVDSPVSGETNNNRYTAYNVSDNINGDISIKIAKEFENADTSAKRLYGIAIETNDCSVSGYTDITTQAVNLGQNTAVGNSVRVVRVSGPDKKITFNGLTIDAYGENSGHVIGIDSWAGNVIVNENANIKVVSKNGGSYAIGLQNCSYTASNDQISYSETTFNGASTTIYVEGINDGAQAIALEKFNDSFTDAGNVTFNSDTTTITVKSNKSAIGVSGTAEKKKVVFEKGDVTLDVTNTGTSGTGDATGIISDLVVKEEVKNFNINVTGSGIDTGDYLVNNGTSALNAAGHEMNIAAQNLNVTVNASESTGIANRSDTHGIIAIKGGSVNVTSKNINVTVNDSVGDAYGVLAGWSVKAGDGKKGNGNITLGGDDSVVTVNVTAKDATGIMARGQNGESTEGSTLTVNGKLLDIDVNGDASYGVYVGNGTNGSQADKTSITINSETTDILATGAESYGIMNVSDGKLNINSNVKVEADTALNTRGNAQTYINTNEDGTAITGKTTVLKGDIAFDYATNSGTPVDATVKISLDGEGSSWTGDTKMTDANGNVLSDLQLDTNGVKSGSDATNFTVSKFTLNVSNGAKWTTDGDSFVNNLNLADGVVEMEGENQKVLAGTVTGDGTITTTNISNNMNIANDNADELTVRAAGELANEIASMSEADQKEALQNLTDVVTTGTGNDEKTVADKVGTTQGAVAGAITADVVTETDDAGETVIKVTNVSEGVHTGNQAIGEAAVALKAHWRAHMNDMNKRMGELRNANGERGVWTRMVRGESEFDGAKMQYNQYQLGYDEKLSVDKRWTVGAAVTFSEGDSNYSTGSTEDDSTAFAIYGSKLNNDGTFVDLIARYANVESDLDDINAGKGDYSAHGYSVSAEFGKRIQQGNGLWIEPQVEVTYGTLDSADFTFSKNGNKVHVGDIDSLIGRVGFSLGKDIKEGNVYARASYLYDFDGETETTYTNGITRSIKEDLGGGWWEVGVGANINLSKATYIYADVEKTFGGEVDTNWQWNLGVRYSF